MLLQGSRSMFFLQCLTCNSFCLPATISSIRFQLSSLIRTSINFSYSLGTVFLPFAFFCIQSHQSAELFSTIAGLSQHEWVILHLLQLYYSSSIIHSICILFWTQVNLHAIMSCSMSCFSSSKVSITRLHSSSGDEHPSSTNISSTMEPTSSKHVYLAFCWSVLTKSEKSYMPYKYIKTQK